MAFSLFLGANTGEAFAADNVVQVNSSPSAAISQTIGLTVSAATQVNLSPAALVAQDGILTADNVIQVNSSSVPAITQDHILSAAASSQANLSGTGGVTLVRILTVETDEQINISEVVSIIVKIGLVGVNVVQVNTLSAPAIIQADNNLVVYGSIQFNISSPSIIHTELNPHWIEGEIGVAAPWLPASASSSSWTKDSSSSNNWSIP